jgi:hypothetical protein
MSYVMQNIFFGSKISTSNLNEEQEELFINDVNVTSFYNGNCSGGSASGSLIGIQIRTLDEEDELNLTEFINDFDTIKKEKEKEFELAVESLKNSEIFKEDDFVDFDIDLFLKEIESPQLFIFPETD